MTFKFDIDDGSTVSGTVAAARQEAARAFVGAIRASAPPPKPQNSPAAIPEPMQAMSQNGNSGLIMLRRDATGWLVTFIGCTFAKGQDLPVPGTTLRDVLDYFARHYNGKAKGCWLLVAP